MNIASCDLRRNVLAAYPHPPNAVAARRIVSTNVGVNYSDRILAVQRHLGSLRVDKLRLDVFKFKELPKRQPKFIEHSAASVAPHVSFMMPNK
jgi:hypothetical protein